MIATHDADGIVERMRQRLGTVVPVWFPETTPHDEVAALLRQTLADVEVYCRPRHVLVVLDGCEHVESVTREIADDVGRRSGEACRILCLRENEGKGGAVAAGFEALLQDDPLDYLVARDHDGDHDVHDMPRLVRRLEGARDREATENVFAVGSRPSPQMALGWVRGEYEALLNRALIEGVNASLAADGRRVDLRYSLPETRYPDFQSGYKLYTRRTAEAVIGAVRSAHANDPSAGVKRWGGEFVTVTELLLQGAIPVEVSRTSYDEQPQTTFDESDRIHAFGRQFVWLFRRLGTPSRVARLISDNAIAQSPVRFASGMWDEVLAFREYICTRAYPDEDWGQPPPHGELL